MTPETALARLFPMGFAPYALSDDQQTLVDIARKRAEQNAEELELDAKKADLRLLTATSAAVSAFNDAYPALRIGSEPLTPGQKDAFTAFVARQPAPPSLDAIGRAGTQLMAEVNARELVAEQTYLAELAAYEEKAAAPQAQAAE